MKRLSEMLKRQEGYTFLEVAIAFTVVFMISAMMAKVVSGGMGKVDLDEAQANLRTYQEAVVLYYAHHEKTPTNEDLYSSFLKGKKDLGYRVISARDFENNLDLLKPKATADAPLADLLDVNEQKFIEMPKKWIIVSEEKLDSEAEFIYAVDDKIAVVVPLGKAPFDLEAVLNIQPTADEDDGLIG